MSMGDECEVLGIKTASIFFHFLFSNSFMVYLIHVFICSFFFFLEYRLCVRPCADDTGTKGAIPGLRRIHSLVRETHESAVQVQLGKCCLSQRWAEDPAVSPEEEHLTRFGGKGVGKVLTQGGY